MSVVSDAAAFAAERHAGQVRKYTGDPYIVHPASVVVLVRDNCKHTHEMLAAAWLHDTVEDTNTTLYEVEATFGTKVSRLVDQLTNVARLSDGNREARMRINHAHLRCASNEAKTIKLADSIDNVNSFLKHDPKFALIYCAEKCLLLPHLRGGSQKLWNMLNALLKPA